MKYFKYLVCLVILSPSLFSCKKSNDQPPASINKNLDLSGTIWAGEYNYTTGVFKDTQPFSMELNSDGTIMWYDVISERAGGTWTVKDSTVTLLFPNGTFFHATVSKDKWNLLNMDPKSGFLINSVSLSAHPDPAVLNGTHFSGVDAGKIDPLNLNFDSENTLQLYYGGNGVSMQYAPSGGGIRFTVPTIQGDVRYYLVVQRNNSVLTGVRCDNFLYVFSVILSKD